jgi:hypothetical protein
VLLILFLALLVLGGGGVGLAWYLSQFPSPDKPHQPPKDTVASDGPNPRRDTGTDRTRDTAPDQTRDTASRTDSTRTQVKLPPPPPLSREEQARVDKAIADGVAYLKKQQDSTTGIWPGDNNGVAGQGEHFKLGYNALMALALLECGVEAKDPSVKYAIDFVRENCRSNTEHVTYQSALSILLLDRVGTQQDKRLIRSLALRLIHGQQRDGGWTYTCPESLSDKEEESLTAALELTRPRSLEDVGLKSSKSNTSDPGTKGELVPAEVYAKATAPLAGTLKNIPALLPADKVAAQANFFGMDSDNSNTQFALIALWVAGRDGVPTERTLAVCAGRFRTSQEADGRWGYRTHADNGGFSMPAMTGAGLLALGVGHGLAVRVKPDNKDRSQVNDAAIQKGMTYLADKLGTPLGPNANRPKNRDRNLVCLYNLWTIERVGVMYSSTKLGGKDWYQWGAELLVDNQGDDGSWACGNYWGATPRLDTSFALLFLKRANFVQDLSDNVEFVIDSSK